MGGPQVGRESADQAAVGVVGRTVAEAVRAEMVTAADDEGAGKGTTGLVAAAAVNAATANAAVGTAADKLAGRVVVEGAVADRAGDGTAADRTSADEGAAGAVVGETVPGEVGARRVSDQAGDVVVGEAGGIVAGGADAGGLGKGAGGQVDGGGQSIDAGTVGDARAVVGGAGSGDEDGAESFGGHSGGHPNHVTTHAVLAEAKDAMRRPDFRRAIVCGVIALAAPGAVLWLGKIRATHLSAQIAWFACIGACALFGVIAVRSAANEVGRMVRPRGGPGVAGVLRLLITLVGYIAVLATVLDMFGVRLGNLLLSGAITGVVVGIAAQQSLGNAFAGLVLLFSRPFAVGDTITVSSGALGGEHRGEVVAITMMFTVLETKDGPLSLPNSGVLAAATGRRTPKSR